MKAEDCLEAAVGFWVGNNGCFSLGKSLEYDRLQIFIIESSMKWSMWDSAKAEKCSEAAIDFWVGNNWYFLVSERLEYGNALILLKVTRGEECGDSTKAENCWKLSLVYELVIANISW